MQLGQALGIACSGEQPGAPAPLACAERRISHRHLQGTAAQATEPDPRGAGEGMNCTFPAVQVWFTLILRAFPLSPNTARELGVPGVQGGSAPRTERWQVHTPSPQPVQVGTEGVTAGSGEGCQNQQFCRT